MKPFLKIRCKCLLLTNFRIFILFNKHITNFNLLHMKNILFITLTSLFMNLSFGQTIVSNYDTYKKLFKVEKSVLSDYNTYKKLQKCENNVISNYDNYQKLYKVENGIVIDYNTYKKLYKIENGIISNFNTYKKLYKIENGIISDYNTYKKLYKIEGTYTECELVMILFNLELL